MFHKFLGVPHLTPPHLTLMEVHEVDWFPYFPHFSSRLQFQTQNKSAFLIFIYTHIL
jgi:hypothetical protein